TVPVRHVQVVAWRGKKRAGRGIRKPAIAVLLLWICNISIFFSPNVFADILKRHYTLNFTCVEDKVASKDR
ncbi:hypothetical protein DPEC_G00346490, partial [Dallia pectoralis]